MKNKLIGITKTLADLKGAWGAQTISFFIINLLKSKRNFKKFSYNKHAFSLSATLQTLLLSHWV
jgi:hypothetical protein